MKFLNLSLALLLMGCTHKTHKMEGKPMDIQVGQNSNASRSIASVNPNVRATVVFGLNVREVNVCGKIFSELSGASSSPKFKVENQHVQHKNLPLGFSIPKNLVVADSTDYENYSSLGVTHKVQSIILNYPLLPNIPIVDPHDEFKNKLKCAQVVSYYNKYLQMKNQGKLNVGTQSGKLTAGAGIKSKFTFHSNLSSKMNALFQKGKIQHQINADQISVRVQGRHVEYMEYVIIADDQYLSEAEDLQRFYFSQGKKTIVTAVSDLPGYHASDATPDECQGDFYKECYHTWGDAISGVSQLAVPSLKGFHQETTAFQQYQRVSYIPGLVRAYLRGLRQSQPIKGLLLIGSDKVFAPYYLASDTKYGHSYWGGEANAKLHTDVAYMLPQIPLTVETTMHNYPLDPMMWSCRDLTTNAINLKYWCSNNEWRHWPTPALSAYRWAPYSPMARTFTFTQGWGDPFFDQYNVNDIIAVGRLVTQEKMLGHKDPIVENYLQKITRWHHELPYINSTENTLSNGGSTSDTWIFEAADIISFKNAYGSNSKIYASEFFVPLSKCNGCTYKSGPDIFNEMANKNRVAMMINGHGGHIGVQAPYSNPNNPSDYTSEKYVFINGDLRVDKLEWPGDNTLKVIQNGSSLFGHVIANSCDLSNFNLDTRGDQMLKESDTETRSFAEQWIAHPDGGAVNTYLNSDVGWGGSDNAYNQKFVGHVKTAWAHCGDIGDALKLTVLDMIKGNTGGAWSWQLLNRQFFGAPMNAIARRNPACNVVDPVDVDLNNPTE